MRDLNQNRELEWWEFEERRRDYEARLRIASRRPSMTGARSGPAAPIVRTGACRSPWTALWEILRTPIGWS